MDTGKKVIAEMLDSIGRSKKMIATLLAGMSSPSISRICGDNKPDIIQILEILADTTDYLECSIKNTQKTQSLLNNISCKRFCRLDPMDDNVFEQPLTDYSTTITGCERLDGKGYPKNIESAQENLITAINALGVPESRRKEFDDFMFALNGYVTVCEEGASFVGMVESQSATTGKVD